MEKMVWNAATYSQFKNERMQPPMDLVTRLSHREFDRIIDIGCGSGMSTIPIRAMWPKAKIIGIDRSEEMLKAAHEIGIDVQWITHDCNNRIENLGTFDLVFSNAFLQWIDNQEEFLKNIKDLVAKGGILAMQIPDFDAMPVKTCIDSVASQYKDRFSDISATQCHNENVETYYNILNRYYQNVQIWETGYCHIMEHHKAIVDFIASTALRPYISRLDEKEIKIFENAVLAEIKKYYQIQENNKVLFEFKRIFFIAER
ncbi:MAG: methyltransferase domain-containing protein [Lachnospiraceae bacterium]|nr:methyltransferase domain-containing protein [Lachnospiraceae bacterium]